MENLDKSGLKYFWDKVKGYISARDARTVQPVGSSMVWYGPEDTIPNDYMREDGRSLKVSEYPELFAIIGYTYGGEGDYFNLPDSRGRTVVHLEDSDEFGTLGAKVGWKVHTLTTAQLPSHGHSFAGTAHNHSFTGSEHTHTFTGTGHKHTFTGTAHNHGFTGSSHYHSYSKSATTSGSTTLTVDQMPSHQHATGYNTGSGGYASGSAFAAAGTAHTSAGSSAGGGWYVWSDNRGGSKGHTHSISLSSANTGNATQGGTVGNATATGTIADATAGGTVGKSTQGGTVGNATQGGTVGNTGSGESFNIIQPSIVGIRIIRVKSDAYTKDIRNLDVAIDEAQTKIASLENEVATLKSQQLTKPKLWYTQDNQYTPANCWSSDKSIDAGGLTDFLEYVRLNAPVAMSTWLASFNGFGSSFIVMKVSNLYLSCIEFSYDGRLYHHHCYDAVWLTGAVTKT